MKHTDLEKKLQRELDAVVIKSRDVFSAALGVARTRGAFEWVGAAGRAYDGRPCLNRNRTGKRCLIPGQID